MRDPAPDFELSLLAVPKAVPELRHALSRQANYPHPDVQLCLSELLSNVIRHLGEGTPVTVRVTGARGRIRVAVTDPDPRAWPLLRPAGGDDETGRGLGPGGPPGAPGGGGGPGPPPPPPGGGGGGGGGAPTPPHAR
ncbi:ATP-binding protein, partial [Streptomyces sp. NPDC059037]|uniref:ATP-binding protein n=1 Tax=Streptomyces sp. NPDC059037 TaxID=3346710 RepID=UPI0036B1EFC3